MHPDCGKVQEWWTETERNIQRSAECKAVVTRRDEQGIAHAWRWERVVH